MYTFIRLRLWSEPECFVSMARMKRLLVILPLLPLLLRISDAFLTPAASVQHRNVAPLLLLLNRYDQQILSWKRRNAASGPRRHGGSPAAAVGLGLLPDDTFYAAIVTTAIDTMPPDMAAMTTNSGGTEGMEVVAGLDPSTTIFIFLVGLFPFAVATVEFWRRIRLGQAFGTGLDSVVFTDATIGEDNAPRSSRGTRVLGRGAVITAIILFGVAAAVIGLAVVSVVTSGIPDSL
jgi:hypothetical protein